MTRWALLAIALLWLPSEAYLVWRSRDIDVVAEGGRTTDIVLICTLSACVGLTTAVTIWSPHVPIGPQVLLRGVGLLLVVAGAVIRLWAVRTLGVFFSVKLVLQPDQPLITAGPYRVVRHPSYTGVLVAAVGIALALNSYAVVAVLPLPLVAAYVLRIKAEERFLRRALPAYDAYVEHTWRLCPYLW